MRSADKKQLLRARPGLFLRGGDGARALGVPLRPPRVSRSTVPRPRLQPSPRHRAVTQYVWPPGPRSGVVQGGVGPLAVVVQVGRRRVAVNWISFPTHAQAREKKTRGAIPPEEPRDYFCGPPAPRSSQGWPSGRDAGAGPLGPSGPAAAVAGRGPRCRGPQPSARGRHEAGRGRQGVGSRGRAGRLLAPRARPDQARPKRSHRGAQGPRGLHKACDRAAE